MTDTKLRELERRWKESNAAEDEAAYLLERVRVGDLEKEKLELAAYCGHEGARLALGDEALPTALTCEEDPSSDSIRSWAAGLRRWDGECSARAALAVAVASQALLEGSEPLGHPSCLEQAEACLILGSPSAARLAPLVEEVEQALRQQSVGFANARPWIAGIVKVVAARSVSASLGHDPGGIGPGETRVSRATPNEILRHAISYAVRGLGVRDPYRAMRGELVSWVLGYGDPVRDRVERAQLP